jgi:hypothetical protein
VPPPHLTAGAATEVNGTVERPVGINREPVEGSHAVAAGRGVAEKPVDDALLHTAARFGRHFEDHAVTVTQSSIHGCAIEIPRLIDYQIGVGDTAAAIQNPFEQALFAMVQLPYLQPFDDVNKRVSRLSANIPFIKRNLSPLSFIDVPRALYTDAVLGVYELNQVDLLRDVFIWAYERSAARYAAVRQSLGEPDPFRFKHKAALRQIVGEVMRGRMDRKAAAAYVAAWVEKNHISEADREKFRDMAEAELVSLHEGNFARYQIRPSEFEAWQQVWAERKKSE